jgi:predicted pyridoxine 5'-phosphate oxidase superfamily flavin-nucleotide-binding protein
MTDSPYHEGERALQEESGMREISERMGRKMIRPTLPDQHRAFYAQLSFVVVGSLDAEARPWASMLVGAQGFVSAPDAATLRVEAAPHPFDPLHDALQPGAALGVLGIQLETRRRNRVNGRISELGANGFSLHVQQSFGNCPKYITPRASRWRPDLQPTAAGLLEPVRLSESARACIAAADTCFIASASSPLPAADDPREGVDASHRGGPPGFVVLEQRPEHTRLYMPDYPGNNAFNTLGNLARFPRAGLLFPAFKSGDVLMLSCDTQILHVQDMRVVAFDVQSARWLPQHMPFEWAARP